MNENVADKTLLLGILRGVRPPDRRF
eukprot:COSAG04_NODE_32068_length_253_cov_0.675325_1_plen_25_part_10